MATPMQARRRSLGFALAVCAAAAWLPAAAQEAECLSCHADLVDQRVVHAPLHRACRTCHEGLDAGSVPHRGQRAEAQSQCARCHAPQGFQGKFTHAPVAADKCTLCHTPHSSADAGLLVQPGPSLCLSCHADVAQRPHLLAGFGGKGHPLGHEKGTHPVEDPLRPGRPFGCTSCHEPHRSEYPRLSRFGSGSPAGICRQCHKI
ncbi:MAG: cytochrome c3 family protein [Pseudomonadota bacterium]